eukprot:CAMPEP_0118651978 /NCGR_PEP_ID=MMETSP0785-20121206/11070_1 /TAXON_ID=91992 /ORGANISM="Bolidomonas pacifica, Strain CCMP 1866" /LENGTH=439 /DNA_ID=CAMNT_0006544459 /DNA_START=89 /DNA_END=1405 /DNA_ORIENTATION=+
MPSLVTLVGGLFGGGPEKADKKDPNAEKADVPPPGDKGTKRAAPDPPESESLDESLFDIFSPKQSNSKPAKKKTSASTSASTLAKRDGNGEVATTKKKKTLSGKHTFHYEVGETLKVSQVDASGGLIRHFKSIAEAHRELSLLSNISTVDSNLRGKGGETIEFDTKVGGGKVYIKSPFPPSSSKKKTKELKRKVMSVSKEQAKREREQTKKEMEAAEKKRRKEAEERRKKAAAVAAVKKQLKTSISSSSSAAATKLKSTKGEKVLPARKRTQVEKFSSFGDTFIINDGNKAQVKAKKTSTSKQEGGWSGPHKIENTVDGHLYGGDPEFTGFNTINEMGYLALPPSSALAPPEFTRDWENLVMHKPIAFLWTDGWNIGQLCPLNLKKKGKGAGSNSKYSSDAKRLGANFWVKYGKEFFLQRIAPENYLSGSIHPDDAITG